MDEIRDQVTRRFAAVALTAAYLVVGPSPQLISAMERIYAVAVSEEAATSGPDPLPPYRVDRGPATDGPRRRAPRPARPSSRRP